MSFQDTVSDAFGLILVGAAVILAWWEIAQQRSPERDAWFVTPRRFRRRLFLSGLLGLIGLILTLEARKVLPVRGIVPTLVYAATLGGLTLFLLIISLADIADTLNSAARKSLSEMDRALKAHKQGPEQASEKTDDEAHHS